MKRPPRSRPKARQAALLVQKLADDTVVYDLERHRGHCLNRGAAVVWAACDGATTPAAIAKRVSRELGASVDAEYVAFALRRLERAHLLEAGMVAPPRVSRRELARRLGLVGASSLLLPTVLSIVAPTALQAATNVCLVGQCVLGGVSRRGCCCTINNRTCIQLGATAFNFCGGAAC